VATLLNPHALELTRRLLLGLRVLNILYGAGILVIFAASIVAPGWTLHALGVREAPGATSLVTGMRALMIVGMGGAVVAHLILTRLVAIVDTVREGDPFVPRNATRLQQLAWLVLGAEVLHLVVGAIGRMASAGGQQLDLDWSFSFTPWLAMLLLFVLARVFQQGTRMRADLEGTV
jgi:hypothetical protein